MEMVTPPLLKAGDRVWVVLPSGSGAQEPLQAGIDIWRNWGYDVVPMLPQEPAKLDYLAGSDRERLTCLQAAFDDPDCRAILCGRGGYGATRLLLKLDWRGFMQSPKWIVGFSDITALLWAAASRGIASIHGPIVAHMPLESEASRDRLHRYLTEGSMPPILGHSWMPGRVTGLMMPANLTVATALFGTSDWPLGGDRPIVLALEDINEQDYRIDRMLTQWRHSGALKSVVGIALGRFCWTDDWSEKAPFSTDATLRDRLLDLKIPVVAGLEFGHGEGDNLALPVGLEVVLDGDRGTVALLQNPSHSAMSNIS